MAMKPSAKAGFTLVELMIALVAGAFAVSAVYYLNGVSSRAFSEQMRVSETQMSLRSAMEQLRRDFTRAGYLATPDSNLSPNCDGTLGGVADRRVRAVQIAYDGSNVSTNSDVQALLGAPTTNSTRADLVDLWGNFATADAYLVDPNLTTSTKIYFQITSEAFRRSFYDPAPANAVAAYNGGRFAAVFVAKRMVRVEHNGRYFYRDIVSVDSTLTGPPSVTIAALPGCFEPTGWSAISPMVHYQYRLESDATADLARLKVPTANAMIGSRRTMLVRREWRDGTSTTAPEANTSHLLLDYAVEFSVDAVYNTAAALARPTWGFSQNGNVTTQSTNGPSAFRSLLVTLTARSPETDPKLPTMARTTFNTANTFNSPLLMFRVIDPAQPTIVMNARVRTLRSEIFLLNL
jgi:prepilin-type N-terminal cleavage/methylation domain-containing protein